MDRLGTRWMPLVFALLGCISAAIAAPFAEGLLAFALALTPSGANHLPQSDRPTEPRGSPQNEPSVELVPPPPNFQARLVPRGGRSGDVQVSLIWDDTNDLDLHCVGPDGHEICPAIRETLSPAGGKMDLDANAGCHKTELSATPVENIYWPTGHAPAGTYRVYVSAYERCEPASTATKFRINILANGARREAEGALTVSGRAGKQLVTEFTVERPAASLGVPPSPKDAGQTRDAAPAPAVETSAESSSPRAPLGPALCAAPLGGLVALALFTATNRRLNRRPLVTPSRIVASITAGAAAFGGAWVGRVVDGWVHTDGTAGAGTALGWVLVAVLLAFCVSFFPPRVDLKKRVIVGAVSGLVAAGAYFAGAGNGEWFGRLLAGLIVGGAAGVLVGSTLAIPRTAPPALPAPPPARPPVVPVAEPAAPVPKVSPPSRPAVPAKSVAAAPAAPKVVAPPRPVAGKPPSAPDACPYCRNGTKHPGAPGARYCMIHDQTY